MKRYTLFTLIVSLLFISTGFSQQTIDWKDRFKEANSYFLYEEYNEALPIYLQLLNEFPDNHNIQYRIGVCYLNTPGEKEKSIDYLEKAAKHISDRYRGENFNELNAPPETLFRLGDAYRVNNQLDKALDTYKKFKRSVDERKFNMDLVEEQIQACNNAKELLKKPLFLDSRNVGDVINSRFSDYNPVVSADGKSMAFMRKLQFFDAVFFSRKVDGKWTNPENLTFQLGEDEDLYVCSLSADGTEMYLYKMDNYDGNICVSTYDGQSWSKIKRLNDNINTKYWESHASISHDGLTLYFTSNRKGGYGDLDIYVSTRDSIGAEWGPPQNLGPTINTPYNEDTPFISDDGSTLYFSSYGHYNMGGYDVFSSNLLEDGTWSAPLNMSYPVNTPDDNLFYYPFGDGSYAYYAMYSDQGFGGQDIFQLEIYSDQHPKKYIIHGLVSLNQVQGYTPDQIRVKFLDRKSGQPLATAEADSAGSYEARIPQGDYQVVFEADKFLDHTARIKIDPYERRDSFALNATLDEADIVAEMEISDTAIYLTKGDVRIDLVLEKNSTLVVETIRDTAVVNREEFEIKRKDYLYKLEPEPGETTLRFTLTDEKGNKNVKETHITFEPPRPKLKPAPVELENMLDQLRSIATGEIKNILDNTSLPESKIYTERQLRRYLVEQSNQPAEVDTLFLYHSKLAAMTPSQVIDKLITYAGGDLLNLAQTLEKETWRDSTSFSLIEALNAMSDRFDFDPVDIRRIMMIPQAVQKQKVAELKGKIEEMAEGKLRSSLEDLQPDREGITNNQELVEYLIGKAEMFGYNKDEVFRIVSTLASGGKEDVLLFLETLTNAADGALKDFLRGLDHEQVKEMTPEELLEYILAESINQPYTADQVWDLLFHLMEQHAEIADKVVQKITGEQQKGPGWVPWVSGIAGLLVLFILFFLWRKNRKRKEEEQN